nr:unnamed protein product [Digitaria exilis]
MAPPSPSSAAAGTTAGLNATTPGLFAVSAAASPPCHLPSSHSSSRPPSPSTAEGRARQSTAWKKMTPAAAALGRRSHGWEAPWAVGAQHPAWEEVPAQHQLAVDDAA